MFFYGYSFSAYVTQYRQLQVVKVCTNLIHTVHIDIICFVKYLIYQFYSLTLIVKLKSLMHFIYEKKIIIIQLTTENVR